MHKPWFRGSENMPWEIKTGRGWWWWWGIPGQLCACPLSNLLRTVLTDRALVRETGTKFIVGVWGSQFPSCTVGTQSRGGALEAKTGFVALLASAQHHLPPIKLSNYRRVVPPTTFWEGKKSIQEWTDF